MKAVTCLAEVEGVCPRCHRPNLRAAAPAIGPLGIRLRWRDEKGRMHSARVSDALQPLVRAVGLTDAARISGRHHTVPLDLRKPIVNGMGLQTGLGTGTLQELVRAFGPCELKAPLDPAFIARVFWSTGLDIQKLAKGLRTTPKQVREWLQFKGPASPKPSIVRHTRECLRSARKMRALLTAVLTPNPCDASGDEITTPSQAGRRSHGLYRASPSTFFRRLHPEGRPTSVPKRSRP